MNAKGVNPILPTPFTQNGAVDVNSLRRLIDFQKEVGVHGVAILGFMGEAHKLSEAERQLVIETVAEQVKDEGDIWVGVRALGTMGAVEQAKIAEQAGATGVFVAPISIQSDEALYEHYRTVHENITIPVMIHDFPPAFGIILSAELIAKLGRDGICPYIKLEDAPVGGKMSQVIALSEGKTGVFGGLGGLYYLEELERGALGIMTGFAYPEALVRIYELFAAGEKAAAAAVFDRYAPLIRYEFQPKIGLAFRKHVFKKRGIFATDVVRSPATRMDDYTQAEFERTIARTGLALENAGVQHIEL